MSKVHIPAQLAKAETMSDRGVKLVFYTAEVGSEAKELFGLVHSEGWLIFSQNNDIAEADIPDEKADPMLGTKTQAQRLRSSLYRLWEQRGKKGSFEQDFYRPKLEQIIDRVKEELHE